jgi:predicted  nucleic acid-binding Zn-ribbon protein
MANGNTEDWLVKLQDALTDLKIVTTNVESKLDQLKEGMEKIEHSMTDLSGATAKQETRVSILEEKYESCTKLIPHRLGEDFAIIKSQVKTLHKVLWIVSTCMIGVVFEIFVTRFM